MKKTKDYEISSGNVFKDMGFPDPEKELVKAQNSLKLFRSLKE